MGRMSTYKGSLYHGSILLAVLHLAISIIAVLIGIHIMKNYSWSEVAACSFLLYAVVGIFASVCMLLALFLRSSHLAFLAFVIAFVEAFGFMIIFGMYFFTAFDPSTAIMVGDQDFAMPINAVLGFISLYFTFAYSRCYRCLFSVEDESHA